MISFIVFIFKKIPILDALSRRFVAEYSPKINDGLTIEESKKRTLAHCQRDLESSKKVRPLRLLK